MPAGAQPSESGRIFHEAILDREIRGERWEYVTDDGRIPLTLSATPLGRTDGGVIGTVAVFSPRSLEAEPPNG